MQLTLYALTGWSNNIFNNLLTFTFKSTEFVFEKNESIKG